MAGNRFAPKSKIRKGDKVVVVAGADKGMSGEVLELFPHKNRAIVDGVNVATKHTKPSNNNPGGRNEINNPIHLSNLMLVDPKSGEPTRVGFAKDESGATYRIAKKSGERV